MTEREQCLKLLAENAGTISDNAAEFLIRQIEDLEAAGVKPDMLAVAMMHITAALLVKALGAEGAASELESLAVVCRHARRRLEGAGAKATH